MTDTAQAFQSSFLAITGHSPMPWQERLFCALAENSIPNVCDIPTGLGKTSILAIWLLALAHQVGTGEITLPRRLVYVVNRRTVVDQATREAENLREALLKDELGGVKSSLLSLATGFDPSPLAISTLRGQFADNGEWAIDPARPAIVLGTIDMIGSRLLFSGYGRGFKSRPLHAAFLGQDALLVHDEAHLEPAFQALVTSVAKEQTESGDYRRLRVMELTATSRTSNGAFSLGPDDHRNETVRARTLARKGLRLHAAKDEKAVVEEVLSISKTIEDSEPAVLIFLRTVEGVTKVAEALIKAGENVQVLTGTLRGLERDELANSDPIFARFSPDSKAPKHSGRVFLVCTAAGEVGVNLSADHLICDLSTFDSMAQRFGRVNRFGKGDASIEVVFPTELEDRAESLSADEGEEPNTRPSIDIDECRARTLRLLRNLPVRRDGRYDACPSALGGLPPEGRWLAFAPQPSIRPLTDVLLDTWAMTSIRTEMPGRPPVGEWLRGVSEWEPPETSVAWRDEVLYVTAELMSDHSPDDLLDEYPIKPHELLRDRTSRVQQQLSLIAERHPDDPLWILDAQGNMQANWKMSDLLRGDRQKSSLELEDCTVLLSPGVGGLKNGLLQGNAPHELAVRYDVSDRWLDSNSKPRRCRVWDETEDDRVRSMRLIRAIDARSGPTDPASNGERDELRQEHEQGEDDEQPWRTWRWYVQPRSADDDGSRASRVAQELSPHLEQAEHYVRLLVDKLQIGDSEASALQLSARWHDLGKNRLVWQRSIGNAEYPGKVLAKSGAKVIRLAERSRYRHELGSVMELSKESRVQELDEDTRILLIHIVAAHHGRARPSFPLDEAFDPSHPSDGTLKVVRSLPVAYARLQKKYGRWGLAYLESILRAADAMASQGTTGGAK